MKNISELINEKAQEYFAGKKELNFGDGYIYSYPKSKEELVFTITKWVNRQVPAIYENAEITDYDLLNSIRENYKKNKGYYFYGSVGTGKTYLLYAIFRRYKVNSSRRVKFWNIPVILAECKAMYNNRNGGEMLITDQIETKDIVMIDDIGAEKKSEWGLEVIYRIINYRYENKLTTYFASNLSLEQLAEGYGDRIASRIAEMCEIKRIDGEDRRLNNK